MAKIILKETETYLRPDDSKSNRYIPFIVPEGIKKLYITYSYSPKDLEDKDKSYELIRENILRDAPEDIDRYTDYSEFMPLKNLVTLSLTYDYPDGLTHIFRGAAHRHDKEQYHEIGEKFASPGFLKGKITAGQWSLVLNVHALVTDICTCRIKIEGETEQ